MAPSQHALGYAATGAVRVLQFGEVFARWEQFFNDVEEDADGFVTAGASFSKQRGLDYRQEPSRSPTPTNCQATRAARPSTSSCFRCSSCSEQRS
ncbi:MAG: hypothetical protein AAFN13_13675 [Bacteroidota bacterium]